MTFDNTLALGFRVKSGFAIAVALNGPAAEPQVIARRVVDLSDPKIPATRQPYHASVGTAREDTREISRLTRIIERVTARSIDALLADESIAHRRCRAALVVGSVIDPATVGNPHIRAHASEGKLFRTVLEGALSARGVDCAVFVEKQLADRAARQLGRSQDRIKKVVAAFGDALEGPWRADEKAAATAGWMLL